ncbi:VF530 family protein [Paucibacter sp. R3-3]|uniref:VF530 family protein n=1 Tax=Roseateles agri TaxID=3098619 RepID=A0ABU5DPR4_9BURK|nr:VF530 family protein [Paucibacter sp. R3-3]MDY0748316.1 VF530 family protein [Paucibacter sp. R3-3]
MIDTPKSPDPLHGVTLEMIVTRLAEWYGWEELGRQIPIRCFQSDPSVASSLKFLRKTPWARAKVESLYLFALREQARRRQGF